MIAFRVVIVDDDSDDREMLRIAFEKAGVEPILALESVQELFFYLQSITNDEDLPRLIVSDMNMPGMNGFELLHALKGMHRYRNITIVVCSTSSYASDITKCIAAGAKEFITKPDTIVGYEALTAKVKHYALN